MWQVIPEAVLPSPLTFEAVLNAKSQLSIVLGINRRIFIKNSSGQEQKLPSGTVIAGWFKGKFWHYRRDGSSGQAHAKKSKKSAEEEITETTDADVLFSLKDASSVVAVNGKAITLAELFAERRKTHPDAAVQYHKLQDKPPPGAPGWFELQTEVSNLLPRRRHSSKGRGARSAKTPHASFGRGCEGLVLEHTCLTGDMGSEVEPNICQRIDACQAHGPDHSSFAHSTKVSR